ncbi:MAG TPA: class I SAM-dependent methyltransferase [Candidatus Binatia bacterium]|nr:class I SAM-dependent methyltransferase [Candidatus Binatia bacterium]
MSSKDLSHKAAGLYHPKVADHVPHSNRDNLARDVFRARGFFGALRFYASGFVELLRDLTPERRRSRYGDIDFDFEYGVDTTWATVSLRTRVREWLSGGQYQPSEPGLFREILDLLPIAVNDFTFIDLGSGKGRTLLLASSYPFRRIIGIELLGELNAIALRNLARYRNDQQKCFVIESRAGDARDFEFPAEPTVLYLFNPFPRHVLREVLANLHRSQLATPQRVFVIYHHLVYEDILAAQDWLRLIKRTHQFAIYEAAVG